MTKAANPFAHADPEQAMALARRLDRAGFHVSAATLRHWVARAIAAEASKRPVEGYAGAGDLSAAVPNKTDQERRGFDPC